VANRLSAFVFRPGGIACPSAGPDALASTSFLKSEREVKAWYDEKVKAGPARIDGKKKLQNGGGGGGLTSACGSERGQGRVRVCMTYV